ncbi:hypothetical protein RISK_002847 [Rhodopirellula islandica]|uniref:Uncharacterized protein n=1 Tax=Rhodopirellula islandica TaxID=595434 RepID=A0A0J1BEX7_RHOIS|nr:hypothetical protein RISK_002847 [Rhodopirellula islandica]
MGRARSWPQSRSDDIRAAFGFQPKVHESQAHRRVAERRQLCVHLSLFRVLSDSASHHLATVRDLGLKPEAGTCHRSAVG